MRVRSVGVEESVSMWKLVNADVSNSVRERGVEEEEEDDDDESVDCMNELV